MLRIEQKLSDRQVVWEWGQGNRRVELHNRWSSDEVKAVRPRGKSSQATQSRYIYVGASEEAEFRSWLANQSVVSKYDTHD